MKKGYIYTIVFMLVVSAFFTSLLATADLLTREKIDENQKFAFRKSILYALNIPNDGTPAGIQTVYASQVKELSLDGMVVPAAIDAGGAVTAYALAFRGPGLWGEIEGYLGISADRQSLVGIIFTRHSETPGLGARIDEDIFKSQFRGLSIVNPVLALKSGSDGQVDAITGATSTSKFVIQMINKALNKDLQRLEGLQ